MLVSSIYHQNSKIDIYNSWLGKETIKVNGQTVSSNWSIFGSTHHFVINSDGEEKQCKFVASLGNGGMVFDFYVDGKPVLESPQNRFYYYTIMIAIPLGAVLGVLFYVFGK